jgi:hypothetical protein
MKQFWLVAAAALVVTTLLPDGAFAQRGGFRGGAIGGGFRGAAIGGGFRGVGPGIARVGPGFRSIPSALAALRLITNSNLVDWTIGRSAGFAPLRMRPA